MQPSMEACAWIHQAQDRSWRPYVCVLPMRPCVPHCRMCTTLAGFPEMATSIAGGASTARQCYPRCPEHQVFQDRPLPCPKHVGVTATIFVAAQPTGTSPLEDYGRLLLLPLQDLLQAGGVIDRMRQLEHSRISWAAPRAGSAMVARKCGPAGPNRGRGPAWADNESSWAVLPEYPAGPGGRTRCALLTRYAFGDDTIGSRDSSPPSLGPPGRDPSGERACEWTSGWAGVTRS